MKKHLFVLLTVICGSSAQDITLSKDSLWVRNDPFSARVDMVTFYNNSSDSLSLDSATIHFDLLDTSTLRPGMQMEVSWFERVGSVSKTFPWWMEPQGGPDFRLGSQHAGGATLPESFEWFGPGTSLVFGNILIGKCFMCSSLPSYPDYLEGTLYLHFSNGETVELRLYSDDLREPMKVKRAPALYRTVTHNPVSIHLVNGRRIVKMPYPSLRSRTGNLMIIHDEKGVRPILSGVRSCYEW